MIIPHGKYLLVKILEKPKKKGFIIVEEELDPIVKCQILDYGDDIDRYFADEAVLYFRRYELRDCIDKEEKIYLIKEECILGYEEEK